MNMPSPSLDVRYSAANLEKGARVQARQFVQITFTGMLATLITLMMQSKETLQSFSDIQALALSAGSALFGLVVAAWVGQQDLLIGLLDSYCRALEDFGVDRTEPDAEKRSWKVPCWHRPESGWISRGFDSRFWINNAFGIILIGTALPSTTLLYMTNHRQFATNYVQFVGSFSCLVSIGAIALYVWFERKRCRVLFAGHYDKRTGIFTVDPKRLAVNENRWERIGKHVLAVVSIGSYLGMIVASAAAPRPFNDFGEMARKLVEDISFLIQHYSTLWLTTSILAFSIGIVIARLFGRYGS